MEIRVPTYEIWGEEDMEKRGKPWNRRSLRKISSGLGTPLYADDCTTNTTCISYDRVLIEMDIIKEPPKCILVLDLKGNQMVQEIAYE